jgi:hypothetical protein
MTDSISQALPKKRHPLSFLPRLICILVAASCVAWTLNKISINFSNDPKPAGFGRGLVQGALMPMAMPNLLFGRDVSIYSLKNNGVPYKLGYTAGVNGCGAIFFGIMFWRLYRWRKQLTNPG